MQTIVGLAACAGLPTSSAPPAATLAPTALSAGGSTQIASPATVAAAEEPTVYTYQVRDRYPHDPNAFTQGLIYADGVFYEGTGLYGESSLRRVDPGSGQVLAGIRLPDDVFGEGITLFDGKLYQLTWRERTGFIFDGETFDLLDTFGYPTEGWGLTHDGEQLIMSDGSHRLYYLDPATLAQTGQIEVFDGAERVERLNELEFVEGEIWANIWQTDRIARISPQSGQVTGWIDLTGLLPAEERTAQVDVLNGIAWDAVQERLFVTGKRWPALYEIELIAVEGQ